MENVALIESFSEFKDDKLIDRVTLMAILEDVLRNALKKKYGDDLKWLITFVAGGNNGAVYKADNWKQIGETAGLPKHKAVSMKWNKDNLNTMFVKPTGENKKIIFIKKL